MHPVAGICPVQPSIDGQRHDVGSGLVVRRLRKGAVIRVMACSENVLDSLRSGMLVIHLLPCRKSTTYLSGTSDGPSEETWRRWGVRNSGSRARDR